MRVDLRRADARVTEQLLHGTQFSPCVEQMCREGVAQCVHAGALRRIDERYQASHRELDPATGQPPPARVEKPRALVRLRSDRTNELVATRFVVDQRQPRRSAKRNDALLASLAAHITRIETRSMSSRLRPYSSDNRIPVA